MITFEPFWHYIQERGITTYQLIEEYDLNPVETYRLKHNHNYTLASLDRFCKILSCQPGEIIAYVDDSTVNESE